LSVWFLLRRTKNCFRTSEKKQEASKPAETKTEKPMSSSSSFAAASLGPVRCFCGREIQRSLTRFERLRAAGATIKDALDGCGLPLGCPFRSEADRQKAPTPPPACCRALIMANVDHSDQHSLYQFAVAHGEGPEAVGGGASSSSSSSKTPVLVGRPVLRTGSS
jgi:DNA-directed RNA polymerase subunit N (RpoN/RPB10)